MNLAQTQQAFSAWLRTGASRDAARFGSRARPGLGIYQNNYRSQLVLCLEESFAVTRQWIGSDAFHDAVVHHVERVPPSSWTLDAYPRDFPQTLALRHPEDVEIAELAQLELSLAEAFVGPEKSPVSVERMAMVDWDDAVLRFTPTLDLQDIATNAPAIWTALVNEDMAPAAEYLPEPAALLVWRQDEAFRFRILDASEQRAILVMRNGMSFAALCALLVDDMGDEAGIETAGAWLGQWLADGLLTDVVSNDSVD